MEHKDEKQTPDLQDLAEKTSDELAEDATAEISGGLFPKSGGGGSPKQYVYKIPAPPAPYVPVPFPVGA